MKPSRPSLCWALLLALAASLFAAAPAASAAVPLAEKRVLVLSPFAYGRPGLDAFVRTYVDALATSGLARENIVVEYLNLNRSRDPEYRRRQRELLLLQHAGKQFDLIVALQQPAQDYLLEELPELSPDAPVIVFNTRVPQSGSYGRHRILSAPPDLAVRTTLEHALRLFPDTERLIVAVGAAEFDQKEKQQIRTALAALGRHLVVEYTDDLPMAGMLDKVAAAPPRTIVLLATINRDITGATAIPAEVADRLSKVANAPSFVQYSNMVGRGPVGGAVQHVERLAEQSARSSVQLLQGSMTLPEGVSIMPLGPLR